MQPISPNRVRTLVLIGAAAAVFGCQAPAPEDDRAVEDRAPAVPEWQGAAPVVVPEGTVLRCAVAEDLDLRTARVGDVVTLIATERLVLDGVDAVLPGTHLQARVSQVKKPRTRLQSPELSLDTVTIELPDGSLRDCPARTIHVRLPSDHQGLTAGTLLDVFLSAPIEIPLSPQI